MNSSRTLVGQGKEKKREERWWLNWVERGSDEP